MENDELLQKVKDSLGITGTYQDKTISAHIAEVKEYLKDAGVKQAAIDSEYAAGVISRGVADLWNYGAGFAALSNYFKERTMQLCYKEVE